MIGRRILKSFKETPEGLNVTYDCSPSGPCIPCLYSEKVSNLFIFMFCFFIIRFTVSFVVFVNCYLAWFDDYVCC